MTGLEHEATEALKIAKAKFPHINAAGLMPRDKPDQFNIKSIATAIAFLRQFHRPIKEPNLGSYGLKHTAERWGDRHGMEPYIANGELIVAAIYLGFSIQPSDDGINAWIAISYQDYKPLRDGLYYSR
jgi:hypothetical protein